MHFVQISFSVLLCLGALSALAELAARWLVRRFGDYYVWTPHARTRMVLDRSALPMLEPEVRFEINAAGERGDDVPHDVSKVYRILVGGGSSTECYYIDQPSAWPQVVHTVLNQKRSLLELGVEHVHVGNIARSLAASGHLYRIFERVLPRYEKLDAVVLLVGGSDVVRWLERRTPSVIEDDAIPAGEVFAVHPEGPFGWRPKATALWRTARACEKRLRRPTELRQGVGKSLARCRAMRGRAKEIIDVVPSPKPMLDHYEKNLRRLIQLAQVHAERVIVVRQPWFDKTFTPAEEKLMWSFGTGRPHAEEVTAYYSHAAVWQLMRQVDARTARIAEDLGVEALDLMPLLERNVETYYDELHHTPKGCAVIGNAVANVILGRAVEPDAVESLVGRRAPVAPVPEERSLESTR
jgi:lysophospholipase L1-like esterase